VVAVLVFGEGQESVALHENAAALVHALPAGSSASPVRAWVIRKAHFCGNQCTEIVWASPLVLSQTASVVLGWTPEWNNME